VSVTTPWVVKIPELETEPGFLHGFSTSALGSVGLSHAPDPARVVEARRAFARALGVDPEALTAAGSVHGSDIARVDRAGSSVAGVDGLVTDRAGVVLFATFADCYPIVLWDPVRRAAGLVHAGWRGTAGGVAAAAVRAMVDQYGSAPSDIRAGIGPGICGSCYEVGEEVASRFDPEFSTPGAADRRLLDLAAANAAQLKAAGVRRVFHSRLCTKETPLFPSHRRHPDGTRFGAIVAIDAP
jgi:purine-nucleoside/S-methyl-5'-thioadenosine phosphorylase / adenosine deaminase